MTGRLSSVPENIVTAPLPIPYDEGDFQKEEVQRQLGRSNSSSSQSVSKTEASKKATGSFKKATRGSGESKQDSSDPKPIPPCISLYFLQLVKLNVITKKATNKLYDPESLPSLWSSLKYAMRDLMLELEGWLMNLPKFYDFMSPTNTTSLGTERMNLAVVYHSTRLTTTKPFLGPMDPFEKLKKEDREFNKKHAKDCVESACHIIRILPENADTGALYTLFPWWSIIHFIMQATVVLLIEASLGFEHTPEMEPMVFRAIKKSLEWMSVMSKTSTTSDNAHKLCKCFLDQLGIDIDIEISDPFKPESGCDESQRTERTTSRKRKVNFQDEITASGDDASVQSTDSKRGVSSSAPTTNASGTTVMQDVSATTAMQDESETTAMQDGMDLERPQNFAYADELFLGHNTGLFPDSIFPSVDPNLASNLDYPPEPML